MTRPARAALYLLALLLSACTVGGAVRTPGPAPLILVSIDGFRPDYLDRGVTPTLARLARDGVRATAMRPSFPTLTFPNHYTLVTGLYPDHHGIVENRMVDPRTGARFVYSKRETIVDPAWWGGEPLWVGVERAGGEAATLFWPGSDVAIGGVRPTHWLAYDGRLSSDDRVRRLLAWLDEPTTRSPRFMTLYFEAVDHACHAYGPDSAQVDAALREVDEALGLLLLGLRERGLAAKANVVVVSDHGGTAAGRDRVIAIDDVAPADEVELLNGGILAGLRALPGREAQAERDLLRAHDHMRCWRKEQTPSRLHYGTNPRIPPLLCLADDGWQIRSRNTIASPSFHVSNGEHGYDNDDPEMAALFVASGPAFRRGLVVPEFDNVDVYPLLAHVLGIAAAPNDGDFGAVASMLAQP